MASTDGPDVVFSRAELLELATRLLITSMLLEEDGVHVPAADLHGIVDELLVLVFS